MKIYEVYHWYNLSDKLFKDYVNTFLRITEEAFGYPDWTLTAEDHDTYIR